MIASQFNLDQRIAELRQIGVELQQVEAARGSSRPPRSIVAAIRALVSGAPASGRSTRIAAV